MCLVTTNTFKTKNTPDVLQIPKIPEVVQEDLSKTFQKMHSQKGHLGVGTFSGGFSKDPTKKTENRPRN